MKRISRRSSEPVPPQAITKEQVKEANVWSYTLGYMDSLGGDHVVLMHFMTDMEDGTFIRETEKIIEREEKQIAKASRHSRYSTKRNRSIAKPRSSVRDMANYRKEIQTSISIDV